MKKKELLLNILLVFLILLAVFQSSLLWIQIPSLKKTSSAPSEDRQSLVKRLFYPEKTVINFAKNDHTVVYDSNDLFKQYRNNIFNSFDKLKETDFTEITDEDYMELMDKKSIVFQFTNKALSSTNLFGLIANNDDSNNLQEIYISEDALAYARDGKFFINKDIKFPEINTSLESLKADLNDYVPYLNFKEKYGINKNILTRVDDYIIGEKLSYSKNIENMDFNYKRNLVERFLNIDIDYVNQITRPGGTIYVYGDKYINFNDDALIEYVNNENFEPSNTKLFTSISNAVDFITTRLGTIENLTLVSVKDIEENGNKGYRISLNYIEDNKSVYPANNKLNSYVELDIFSNRVKSFKQEYRKIKNQNGQKLDFMSIIPLEEIIYKNQASFLENPDDNFLNSVLNNIDSITEVYIEDADSQKLTPALKINYKEKELFFSLKNANLLMER